MASLLETRDRNVVPRWRDFISTVNLGELGTGAPIRASKTIELSSLEQAWNAHPGLAFAGDLISAALVRGVPDIARGASEFVLEAGSSASASLQTMAIYVLGGLQGPSRSIVSEPVMTSPESTRIPSPAIARVRAELGARPANAVLWMDLAYLYAVRGLASKAEKAVIAALHLAPANRFVLRSAARFYVHQNRLDEAHRLIRRAPGAKNDPWLLSAEIAISMAAEHTPFFAKEGLSMLAAGAFPEHQLSELKSALGTLEFSHGNIRKARKHLRSSLIDATDNSLAQATWLSENANGLSLDIPEQDYDIERPFEANMYRAYSANKWDESLVSSLKWMKDQPFSGRAARSAGYLANTIFADHEKAEQIAKFGLVSNPKDPGLNITLAYSYACRNQLTEAADELKKINSVDAEEWLPAAVDANYGLIAYRRDQPAEGWWFYSEAVRKADKLTDKRVKVVALTNWAVEEARFSYEKALVLLQEMQNSVKKATGPDIPFLVSRAIKKVSLLNQESPRTHQ